MKTIRKKYYDFAVSDFDGTLANLSSRISEGTVDAIKGFQSRGGIFSVCTGRMSSSILPILRLYDLKGLYICYNGAEICDIETGAKIFQNHLDTGSCVKILKYAEERNLDVIVYPEDRITVRKITDNVRDYMKITEQGCTVTEEDVSEIFLRKGLTSGKALVYMSDGDKESEKTIWELRQLLGDGFNVDRSNKSHVDITRKGVSKGAGIIKLGEILNKSLDKLICFGDELNDRSMFDVAALSVVTENANEEVLHIADVITGKSWEDGVKNAILKYCI